MLFKSLSCNLLYRHKQIAFIIQVIACKGGGRKLEKQVVSHILSFVYFYFSIKNLISHKKQLLFIYCLETGCCYAVLSGPEFTT